MPSLLTGAVMGVAPDSRIEIPDEHTMQILQTRDNYVQVSKRASFPSRVKVIKGSACDAPWEYLATRRIASHDAAHAAI